MEGQKRTCGRADGERRKNTWYYFILCKLLLNFISVYINLEISIFSDLFPDR